MRTHASRVKLSMVLSGLAILIFTGTAQISSVFTPVFAGTPWLLHALSSGGTLILLIAAIVVLAMNLRTSKRIHLILASVYIVCLAIIYLNIWATVFQLSLAGLAVGGSLVLLGSRSAPKK